MELLNSEEMKSLAGGLAEAVANINLSAAIIGVSAIEAGALQPACKGEVLTCNLLGNVKACANYEANCSPSPFMVSCDSTGFWTDCTTTRYTVTKLPC